MTVFMHDGFYVVDGVVRVPTMPEGTIELRVVGDKVWLVHHRFKRGDVVHPSKTWVEARLRVPIAALEELLSQRKSE